MKQCTFCLLTKPITFFNVHKVVRGVNYLRTYCKSCQSAKRGHIHTKSKNRLKTLNPVAPNPKQRYEFLRQQPNFLEKKRRSNLLWRKNNPEKWSLINRAARAKRRALGKINVLEYSQKIASLGNKCQLCNVSGKEVKMTIDHIIPVSRGGTNHIDNLQPLCLPCNKSKFTHILSDWSKN